MALAHLPTDRVPRLLYEEVIGYTPSIEKLLNAHCAPKTPRDYFDMDITSVSFNPTHLPASRFSGWLGVEAGTALDSGQVDEWGVWWRTGEFHHFAHVESPLRGIGELGKLKEYPWPDLDDSYRFAGVRERVAALGDLPALKVVLRLEVKLPGERPPFPREPVAGALGPREAQVDERRIRPRDDAGSVLRNVRARARPRRRTVRG